MINSQNLIDTLQQGFRISVGAAATLVETLQNPQKRDATLQDIKEQWDARSQEWATKGTDAEAEARKMVETLWQKRTGQSSTHQTTASPSPPPGDMASELKDLTQQLAELRSELESLRQDDRTP